jgi:hypothetical protein
VVNRQIQHDWNVSWKKMSDFAWLESVSVKNVRFRMAEMCLGQESQIQHGWNVSFGHGQTGSPQNCSNCREEEEKKIGGC